MLDLGAVPRIKILQELQFAIACRQERNSQAANRLRRTVPVNHAIFIRGETFDRDPHFHVGLTAFHRQADPAGEDRLGSIIRTGVPYVGSCGALDMVNFGAHATVPDKYQNRNLYMHNPHVTLMRTTPDENRLIGEWIGHKLNECSGPVSFYLPEKGVSLMDVHGKAFHDPYADAALFEALEKTVNQNSNRQITRLPHNINDPEFAQALLSGFIELNQSSKLKT